MLRGVIVAVAGLLVASGAPQADAAARKPAVTAKAQASKTTKTAKSKAAKSNTAKSKAAKAKKQRLATASKRHKGKRVAKRLSKQPTPKVKTTGTPLVTVAEHQVDGRVKYGPDRMPPGFAWPPTPAMTAAGKACEAELDALGVGWKTAPAEGMVPNPVIIPSMEIGGVRYTSRYRKVAPTMECQFVRVLALLGPDLRALGVREVQFGSIVRNTLARSHGQTKEFLSRHALGIAMDIKAFVDDTGRVASVEMDYLKGDPLLHGVEDLINRATTFRQVLTPGNDPISHDDHFHIEASVDFTAFR